jgi:ABC-2 type transport system permease protein
MLLVFINTLKGHRVALALATLALAGFGLIIPASYETFGGEGFQQFAARLPRGISAFLKADSQLLLTSGAQGYIGIGLRHPIFLVIASAFAIATASGAIAREVERKTFLLLLARPVERYRIGLARAGETLLGLLLLVAAALAGNLIGSAISGLEIRAFPLLLASVNALALFFAIAGYSYLLSSISSDGGRATALATGVTVLLFLLDFIADLWEPLEPLGYVSPFNYYDPVTVAAVGRLSWRDIALLLSVALAGFSAAVVWFQRRDIR